MIIFIIFAVTSFINLNLSSTNNYSEDKCDLNYEKEIATSRYTSTEDLVGWTYYNMFDLYYQQDGVWYHYGKFPVYFNHSDTEDGCNQWVRFTEYHFMPASYHGNKKIKWTRRVMYQGVYFYF